MQDERSRHGKVTARGPAFVLALVMLLLPTASSGQVPPADRYLCYKATLAPRQPRLGPVQKTLEDQFGALRANVTGFASLCNPVLPAQRPSVHQVGYRTTLAKAKPPQKFAKSSHTAFDQLGDHPLTVVKPLELRAPSAKVLGAGGTGPVDTSGVDHFQCYRATPAKGAPKFAATRVSVADQFGTLDVTLTRITKLCAPVNQNGTDPTAPQHAGHLLCYQAKLPKGVKFPATTVSIDNGSFGPAVLVAKSVAELCLPAFKDAIPTPGPSPTPTASPTRTAKPRPTIVLPCNLTTCPFPGSCQGGICVEPCGPISCRAIDQCCSSSPGDGICCDGASQRCSPTQTSCQTVVCPAGSTYVPSIDDCCSDADLCGTDPFIGTAAFCCQLGISTCEPSSAQNPSIYGATCVLIHPTPTP